MMSEQSTLSNGIIKNTPLFFNSQSLNSVTLLPTIKKLHLGLLRHWITVYSFPETMAADLNTRDDLYENVRPVAQNKTQDALDSGSYLYDGFAVNMPSQAKSSTESAPLSIRIESRAYCRLLSTADRSLSEVETTIRFKKAKTVTLADIASCIFMTKESYNIDNAETLPGSVEDGAFALERQIRLLMHFVERGWIDRGEVESVYAKAVAFIQPVNAASQASQT